MLEILRAIASLAPPGSSWLRLWLQGKN